MRIAWIADYKLKDRMGGAQLTNQYVIDDGRKRGHEIVELGLSNLLETDNFLHGFDFYIVNNFVDMWKHLPARNLLAKIITQEKYVKFAHDYDGGIDESDDFKEFRSDLYNKAQCVVTLSPLHAKKLKKDFEIKHDRILTIPPYIDTDLFKNRGLKRKENSVIGLGEIGEHKGIYNLMKWANTHENKVIDFYGFTVEEFYYFNLSLNRAIDYSVMPLYLNIYETFIHLPEWYEPFGRTVAEAFLCGCRLEVRHDRIGFMSYDWNYADREAVALELESGPLKFWNTMQRL